MGPRAGGQRRRPAASWVAEHSVDASVAISSSGLPLRSRLSGHTDPARHKATRERELTRQTKSPPCVCLCEGAPRGFPGGTT